MLNRSSISPIVGGLLAATAMAFATPSLGTDEEAAKSLARESNCFKCHSVSKDKDGPAFKKVAEKYRSRPDAEKRLIEHITTGEIAKFPDGHEEEHKVIKTDPPKDIAQIRNLVQWILAN